MTSQNSRLLDLPGELRNRIYDYCAETITVSTTFCTSHPGHKAEYRGLTQVCRQIRQEYHPIYMSGTTFEIDYKHISSYWNARYPESADQDVLATYSGKLIVQLDFTGSKYLREDILHLLQRLAQSPRISIRFEWEDPVDLGFDPTGALEHVNALFKCICEKRNMVADLDDCLLIIRLPHEVLEFTMEKTLHTRWEATILDWFYGFDAPELDINAVGTLEPGVHAVGFNTWDANVDDEYPVRAQWWQWDKNGLARPGLEQCVWYLDPEDRKDYFDQCT
ncbi:hypothetical protein NX059_012089 [Plenodomus lindquistii]|nr:hypothetical protein NX059_012089 [Plenodomus lindquistii]